MAGKGVFILGTDTGVGKTVCSLQIIQAIQTKGKTACGFKPVASCADYINGQLINDDALRLQKSSSVALDYKTINPYVYPEPVSPNIAADYNNNPIDLLKIQHCYKEIVSAADYVIVEGVGGWRTPITEQISSVDLVRQLNIPVILVVGLKLGCISHALLTYEAMKADGIQILGWVANGPISELEATEEIITTLLKSMAIPLIGKVPALPTDHSIDIDLSSL